MKTAREEEKSDKNKRAKIRRRLAREGACNEKEARTKEGAGELPDPCGIPFFDGPWYSQPFDHLKLP